MSKRSALPIVAVLAAVIAAWWGGTALLRGVSAVVDLTYARAAVEAEQLERETPSVFDVQATELVGIRYARIDGVVRNNGPDPIRFVEVRCALVEHATGREHDARLTYAVAGEGLPPGNRREFVVYLNRAPGAGYGARCVVVDWRR